MRCAEKMIEFLKTAVVVTCMFVGFQTVKNIPTNLLLRVRAQEEAVRTYGEWT